MFFTAKWIGFNTGSKKDYATKYGNPSPYFRKVFSLPKKVEKAELYCSGTGVFKVYINGQAVANDYLTPGWTDYRKRIPLYSFDITRLLEKDNAIGVVAGDGWAVGKVGTDMYRCNYFNNISVMIQVVGKYVDGEEFSIITDESWIAKSGEILRNDIYMGEYIDHRLSLKNFSLFNYDDTNWEKVFIVHTEIFRRFLDNARVPITTVKKVLEGTFIGKDKNGCLIYDFKQNASGVLKCTVNGDSGAKLIFKYGEVLDSDGSVYTDNLRMAEATDTYICAGEKDEIFRPLFTFHGFRYASILIEGNVAVSDVKFEVMYSDLEDTSTFSCSDKIINQLYSNIVWTQKSNFLNLPTDCPQRDERLGWLGDAQSFCKSAMFNMNCEDFYKKFICDIVDAQLGNGGLGSVAPVIPHFDIDDVFIKRFSAGYREAIVIFPYEHYLMYGDIQVLYDNISNIKRFIRYMEENNEDCKFPDVEQYGDWLNVQSETSLSLITTAFYAYAVMLTARICKIISDPQADYYFDLYEKIKKAFRKNYLNEKNQLTGNTQTSYLLAFAFGLVTADEIRENILKAFKERNDHLVSGFFGVRYALPVLCELGEVDLAYKIFTNTDYPSWGYSVVNGATTVWERWNSWTKENGINVSTDILLRGESAGMNSFNHYSMGACCEWMYEYCLGILPTEEGAGFNKIKIRPFIDFSGKITQAEGSYNSKRGKVSVKWEVKNNVAVYQIDYPENMGIVFDFSQYKTCEQISKNKFKLTK